MKWFCIRQHDSKDCGAACLSTICSHYGLQLQLSKYKELTKTDNSGTNIYGIVDAASRLGMSATALNGNISELLEGIQKKEIPTPFIAHIITEEMFTHYIVVHKFKNNKLIVADPSKGIKKYSVDKFESLWTGNIITFSLTDKFEKKKEKESMFFSFFKLVMGQKKLVSTVIGCSIIIALIGILSAFAFQYIIDGLTLSVSKVNSAGTIQSVESVCIAVISLYLVEALLKIARGYLLSHFSNKLDISIMLRYYNSVVDLPMNFFGTIKTGEIMSRFSDAVKIREAISSVIFSATIDILMVVFGGIILYITSPKLFILTLLLSMSYIIMIFIYKSRIRDVEQKIMESNSQVTSFLKESVEGIATIKSFGNEDDVKAKTNVTFTQMLKNVFKGNVINNNRTTLSALISSIGTIVLFWIGVSEIAEGKLTIGTLITFNALSVYFLSPFVNLMSLQGEIQTAIVAADRLSDIIGLKHEELDGGMILSDLKKEIIFKDVDFRYGNRELVLKKINLSIKMGEKIGIVGESGSGKTTMAKLLMALYEPEGGIVFWGDTDMCQINKKFLRGRISYLPQELFFFADSVMNNLKLGNKEATDEEVQEVCKKCSIHEYINAMPEQYETILEENGANLSGGQKQMLGMARALLKKPDILILDEATSNLDSITESSIEKVISQLGKEEITCIIIAHRLRTIVGCDKIVVLEKGQIIEVGNHKELMKKKGNYYTYWKEQARGMIL